MMRALTQRVAMPLARRYLSTLAQTPAAASTYRPRRALLYMPGSSPKMLQKATTLDVDTVLAAARS
jgi:hypothetical protein